MSSAVWHELGMAEGTCTVCGAHDRLTVGEARFHRNLLERLRREYCAPPARFVTCSDCGWRWSVRADDRTADGVRRRAGTARADVAVDVAVDVDRRTSTRTDDEPHEIRTDDEPRTATPLEQRPRTASRTVLPQRCDGRRFARDWAYPRR